MVTTSARRLDTVFSWPSNAPLQRDLKRLMATLEARFAGLEAVSGDFEDAVQEFEELGLSRLNDVLTPLASEAIERLQDVTSLFSATSTTTQAIVDSPSGKQFLIPVGERDTFIPTPYLAIYATGEVDKGMLCQLVSFDREVGILSVNVLSLSGSGTYSDWEISVSTPPALGGYTRAETDTAIADAITALNSIFALKAPLADPVFTGNPVAPNQALDNSSTRLATTYFVNAVATQIATDIVEAAIAELVIPAGLVDAATIAQVRGATIGSPPHAVTTDLIASASASVGLTDAATIGLDWNTGINFSVTLAGNRTLGNPSNGQPGTWRTVLVSQDANGTRTLGYGGYYVFVGSAPVIATGANKKSRLSIYCRSSSVFEVYPTGIGLTG